MVGMKRLEFVRSRLLRSPSARNSVLVMVPTLAVATLLRWVVGTAADEVPFVTYYPAIVIVTLFAGWRAGIVSIVVASAVAKLVFKQPAERMIEDWHAMAVLGLFVMSCLMLVAIAQTLRVTVKRVQQANDRAEFLNQELMHRVRNSLAIVNSLAALTYQTEPNRFVAVFSKRMAALTRGLDVLSERGGEHCDLRETVESACAPFEYADRLMITGDTCKLVGTACVPLVLAIHELCTNAAKYGAFSEPGGKVTVTLSVAADRPEAGLVWQERDGPPVTTPQRQGLGSALLAHPELGPARLSFEPGGLICEMRLTRAD